MVISILSGCNVNADDPTWHGEGCLQFITTVEGGIMQSDALPPHGEQGGNLRGEHVPGTSEYSRQVAGGTVVKPMQSLEVREVCNRQGMGQCESTTNGFLDNRNRERNGIGGPSMYL